MRLSPKWRNLISGQNRCFTASLFRMLLAALSCPYALAVALRNFLYDRRLLTTHKLPLPIICVGNITVGGTGKTPMVIWLAHYLHQKGLKPALLTRGYHGDPQTGNDEIQLLRRHLPHVPIIIDPDRVRGGRLALAQYHPDILLLDDGFQHRRLQRDLDLVMIDCTCPFGYDYLLPRGLLRESKSQLRRAHVALLSHADQLPPEQLDTIQQQLKKLMTPHPTSSSSDTPLLVHCRHAPLALYDPDARKLDIKELSGKKIVPFCGLGNPQAFFNTLKNCAADLVATQIYPDHHHYQPHDCAFLLALLDRHHADYLLTTEKDWVKITQLSAARRLKSLYWLKIETAITQGREQLCQKIDRLLEIYKQDKV